MPGWRRRFRNAPPCLSLHPDDPPTLKTQSMPSQSRTAPAPGDPAAVVEALDGAARKVKTPCADGSMVWRVWGEGEPLLLFHGGSGSWTHWIKTIPELSKHYELW